MKITCNRCGGRQRSPAYQPGNVCPRRDEHGPCGGTLRLVDDGLPRRGPREDHAQEALRKMHGWFRDDQQLPPQRTIVLVAAPSGYIRNMEYKDVYVALAYRDEHYRPGAWITVSDDRMTDYVGSSVPFWYWRFVGDLLVGVEWPSA